jgi:hypothetical protein
MGDGAGYVRFGLLSTLTPGEVCARLEWGRTAGNKEDTTRFIRADAQPMKGGSLGF